MKWTSFKAPALMAISLLMSTLAVAGPDLGEAQQQAPTGTQLSCL